MHEAVVKTPVQLGNQLTEQTVTTVNRLTGQTGTQTITKNIPILGVVNNVRQVETKKNTLVDINSGQIIDPYQQRAFVGVNPI